MKATVTITYCTKCGWLLRSAYFAQELLQTFADHLDGIVLKPSEVSGVFTITVNDHQIWDRKLDHGFPEVKLLKQMVRDLIAPDIRLGHSDR